MVVDIATKPLTLATSPSEIRSNVIWNVNKRGAVESFDFLLGDDRALSATDDDLRRSRKTFWEYRFHNDSRNSSVFCWQRKNEFSACDIVPRRGIEAEKVDSSRILHCSWLQR